MTMTVKGAGRKGGKARAKNLTKAELSAIGKKGAEVRWKNHTPHYGKS